MSIIKKYFCIISSAALYAASFLWPTYFFFFSFFSFVPLFFSFFKSYRQALWCGFLWAIIGYGITLIALLDLVIILGFGWKKYFCASFFLGYFITSVQMWFFYTRLLYKIVDSWFYAWIFSTVFYFELLTLVFFYPITGQLQGYGIACPLIPLQIFPSVLTILPFFGWFFTRFFLLLFQAGIAFKKKWAIVVGIIPFLYGFIFYKPQTNIDQENKIVLMRSVFKEKFAYERIFEIAELLQEAVIENPYAEVFVLPESAFPFNLLHYPQAVVVWSEASNQKDIIVGAHCYDDSLKKLFNSVFLIRQGRIINRYDKKHLLPFFEKECSKQFLFKNGHTIFMQNKVLFSEGLYQKSFFILNKKYEIRICSELLWDMPKKSTVIALVNDNYYRYAYFTELFLLFVQFKARVFKSKLFYCSWRKKYS